MAGDTAVGRPPLFHQRRAVIAAGEPHCGHIQVQPRQVGPAAGRGGQRQLAADLLGHRSQRLQRPAQPVVVEQTRRHAEQFGHRRRGGPAGHVIQRRRRAEPVGHQRGDHLPVGQHRLPAHRHRVIDELDQAQPIQVVGHQQQRPDVAAGAHRWRIQPGERRRQLLQLARRLQLVLAAQRAQHPVAHPALGVPIRFDQPQVHVASAAFDHRVALNVHAGPIPVPSGWPYIIALKAALQPCNSECLRNHRPARFGPTWSRHAPIRRRREPHQPESNTQLPLRITPANRTPEAGPEIRPYARSVRKTGLGRHATRTSSWSNCPGR